MPPATIVDRIFAQYAAGLPQFPISGGGPDDPPPPPAPPPPPDLGKIVEEALARHGDQTAALKAFASDLYAARDDLKMLRAKLPADGAIVLTGEAAKDWGAYQGLGKPSDLRRTVEEHHTLAEKTTAYERAEVLRGVAAKANVSYPVLARLAGPGLTFEERPVKGKDGKPVPVLHVIDPATAVGEAKAEPVPFDDYAAKHWAEFLPALKPTGAGAGTTPPPRPNPTPGRLEPTRYVPPTTRTTPEAGAPPDALQRHLAAVRGAF